MVAAVAGAEVAPEPAKTSRMAGKTERRPAAHDVAPYRMTGEAAPATTRTAGATAPAPVQPVQRARRAGEAYEGAGGRPRGAAGRTGASALGGPAAAAPSRILERPPTHGRGRQMAADTAAMSASGLRPPCAARPPPPTRNLPSHRRSPSISGNDGSATTRAAAGARVNAAAAGPRRLAPGHVRAAELALRTH